MAFDFLQRLFRQRPDILDKLAESNVNPEVLLRGLEQQSQQQGGLAQALPVQTPQAPQVQPMQPILPPPGGAAITRPVPPTSQPQILPQGGQQQAAPLDASTLQRLQTMMQGQPQSAPPAAQPAGGRQIQPMIPSGPLPELRRRPTLADLLGN